MSLPSLRVLEAFGARVVVDVTQMAGAIPVTMSAWGADALVCSGYKWLSAPGGVALLAVTEELAADIPPLVGWKGSATPFEFKPQELSLAVDARRFELSTMSYSAALGLLASIKLLSGIGLSSIREHADRLADNLVQRVAPLGWTPFRPLGDHVRKWAHCLVTTPDRPGRGRPCRTCG